VTNEASGGSLFLNEHYQYTAAYLIYGKYFQFFVKKITQTDVAKG
jgi:hypothetical protein